MVIDKPVLHRVFKWELVKEILASTELPRATSAGHPHTTAPKNSTEAQKWLEHALLGQNCMQREEGQHLKGMYCLFHQWDNGHSQTTWSWVVIWVCWMFICSLCDTLFQDLHGLFLEYILFISGFIYVYFINKHIYVSWLNVRDLKGSNRSWI